MRLTAVIVVLIHLSAGAVFAGDYVRLGTDSIPAGWPEIEIPFFLERTCPLPEQLMGMSNGFVFTATGDATWEYVKLTVDPELQGWFNLGILYTPAFRGPFPDSLLLGAAGMPPGGMPLLEDCPYFTLKMNIGPGIGEICVDSGFVFSAGAWKWPGLTCGLGGAPDRPLFVDKYGSDDSHPVCMTVYDAGPPPTYDDWVRIGVDSLAAGMIRAQIPFFISRTCPTPELVKMVSTGFSITAIGDVTWSYADYSSDPALSDWFDYNAGVLYNDIDGTAPDTFGVFSIALNQGMPVATEVPYFTIYLDIGPGEGELCVDSSYVSTGILWKFMNLDCGLGGDDERPLFVAKDSSDASHPICLTIYESLCGDLNLDGVIDVDDIVYLSQYIFGNEPMSIVLDKADVDCSGGVDIDDVVYLLNYVFGTGPEPCAGCP